MKAIFLAAVGAALSIASASAGKADFKVIYHHGAWTTLSGVSSDDTPMCVVADTGRNWFFAYKYEAGYNFIMGQLFKKSWSIPKGTQIPITIRVDNYGPWTVNGNGNGSEILWQIRGDAISKFTAQFKIGEQLTITFETGNEPPWHLSLDGSYGATDTMVSCIRNVRSSLGGPSQPYSAAPSQPFTPAPSQPYAAPTQPDSPGSDSGPSNGPSSANGDSGPQV